MALKPETSLMGALAVGTIVLTVYGTGLPGQADIRAGGRVGDETLESVRRQNAWMAASVVSGISLLTKDPKIFIVGGAMVVGLDWITRTNNFVNPVTNKVDFNPFVNAKPSDMGASAEPYAPEPGIAAIA